MGNSVSYRDIPGCHANSMTQSQIASACGCARSTARDVPRKAGETGVSWEDVVRSGEKVAYELVRGRPRDGSYGYGSTDFELIRKETGRDRTMTLSLPWGGALHAVVPQLREVLASGEFSHIGSI